eukprot:457916-Pyramimonas_sp.AAC.2
MPTPARRGIGERVQTVSLSGRRLGAGSIRSRDQDLPYAVQGRTYSSGWGASGCDVGTSGADVDKP